MQGKQGAQGSWIFVSWREESVVEGESQGREKTGRKRTGFVVGGERERGCWRLSSGRRSS